MLRQSARPLLPRALSLRALWLVAIAVTPLIDSMTDCGRPTSASADDATPQKTLVLPGEVFMAGGHTAFLLTPAAESVPATGARPWILYSPTLPAYPDKAELWMHEQFTKAGVAKAASAYDLSADELAAKAGEFCPIERIDVAAQAGVPFCIIHGDQDTLVPRPWNERGKETQFFLVPQQNLWVKIGLA